MLNYFLKIRFLKYYFYKETVLRELHSLTTYEKREAYIETLDKSKYEVKAVDCSNVEEKTEWGGTSIKAGYFALIEDYNTEEKPDIENWVGWDEEKNEPILGTKIVKARLMSNINNWYRHEGERIESTGKIYFMTITDVATGETDPWGINLQVMFSAEGTEVNSTSTIVTMFIVQGLMVMKQP